MEISNSELLPTKLPLSAKEHLLTITYKTGKVDLLSVDAARCAWAGGAARRSVVHFSARAERGQPRRGGGRAVAAALGRPSFLPSFLPGSHALRAGRPRSPVCEVRPWAPGRGEGWRAARARASPGPRAASRPGRTSHWTGTCLRLPFLAGASTGPLSSPSVWAALHAPRTGGPACLTGRVSPGQGAARWVVVAGGRVSYAVWVGLLLAEPETGRPPSTARGKELRGTCSVPTASGPRGDLTVDDRGSTFAI